MDVTRRVTVSFDLTYDEQDGLDMAAGFLTKVQLAELLDGGRLVQGDREVTVEEVAAETLNGLVGNPHTIASALATRIVFEGAHGLGLTAQNLKAGLADRGSSD